MKGTLNQEANWDQLRTGMSERKFEALVGHPESIDTSWFTKRLWNYPNKGQVDFEIQTKSVQGWKKPKAP